MASDRARHLQRLEKFLSCSICQNVITSAATTLSCLHSFCNECANSRLEVTEQNGNACHICSECGHVSPKEATTPFKFIQDFVKLLNESRRQEKPCYFCEEEGEGSSAIWCCMSCKINLCDRCKKIHAKTPNCTTHQYKTYSDPIDLIVDDTHYCSDHKEQVIDQYCTQCHKCICCKCKLKSHLNHSTGSLTKISSQYVVLMDDPSRCVTSMVESSKDEEAYLERERERINNEYQSVSDKYKATRDKLLVEINRQYSEGVARLNEKRDINMGKIETKIKELANKRKKGERLIDAKDVLVQTARGGSLMEGLFSGLLKRVTTEAKQKYALQQIKVKHPVHVACAMVEGQEVSMGTINFKESLLLQVFPWKIRNAPVNIEQAFTNFDGQVEGITLDGNPQRLAFVQDDIWIPSFDPSVGYQVFDIMGSSLKTKNVPEMKSIYAFHQASKEEIIAACSNGLFSLDTNGTVKHKIMDGMFTDVTSTEIAMVAIEKRNSLVKIFKCNRTGWALHSEIELQRNSAYHETVHILEKFIYVCFVSGKICKYDFTGQLVGQYGSSEAGPALNQFHDPFISGSDASKSLIVCDSYNHRIQVKRDDGMWQQFQVQGLFDYPRDIMVVRNCVFVLCGWFPRRLIKFYLWV